MARRRSGRVIDKVRWTGDVLIGHAGLAAGSAATELYALGDQEDSVTVMRARGLVTAWMDAAGAPGRVVQVAIGVRVAAKGTGSTVGIASLTEAEGDWMIWQTATIGYEEMVTDVVSVQGLTLYRFEIDSKAMRRMKPGEELQFVVAQATLQASGSVNVMGQIWFLLGS